MNIFLDTSTLFKLYHEEEGTAEIDAILAVQKVKKIFIAEITAIEFYSAVSKRVRMGEISMEQAEGVINLFEKDYENYTVILIDRDLINNSKSLIQKYQKEGLRTLDALQLASLLKEKDFIEMAKTSDKLLNEIIKLEGIKTE